MDKTIYFDALKSMQEGGANRDYCIGWASGALGNPGLEEQRVTDAYTAGYSDGSSGKTDDWHSWVDTNSAATTDSST